MVDFAPSFSKEDTKTARSEPAQYQGSFFEKLAQKIDENFEIRTEPNDTNRCAVIFSINGIGDLIDMKVLSSSSNTEFNKSLEDAIQLAAPYPVHKNKSARIYIRANALNGEVLVGEAAHFVGAKPDSLSSVITRQIERCTKNGNRTAVTALIKRLGAINQPSIEIGQPSISNEPKSLTPTATKWSAFPEWSKDESSISSKKGGLASRSPLFPEEKDTPQKEAPSTTSGQNPESAHRTPGVLLLSSSTKSKTENEIDFAPYMADLQRRIKRRWFPPRGEETRRIRVRFKIHNNGEMEGLTLYESCSVSSADRAALDAVQNASPFRMLPKGAPEVIYVEFTFDYKVFKYGSGF